MENSVGFIATWVSLPLGTQLLNLLIAASTFSFLLIALFFFIRAVRPGMVTKGGAAISFFFKPRKQKNPEAPISIACVEERPSLLNHRFFRMMRSTQTAGFFQLDETLTKPLAKEVINLAFLKECKFKAFREGMTEFVEKVEGIEDLKLREDAVQHIPSAISDLVAMYEEMSKSLRIVLPGGEVLYGVPSVYMAKFNKWHSDHTAMCLDSINDVLSDRLYEDWYAQLRACLDFLHIAFDLTMQDAKLTLKDLNGDLDREIAEILASIHR